ISEMRDTAAADPIEAFAREKGVTYVKLDGNVGICGNGAGLAMSTVDVVAHVGGKPANFCDLGGGGSAEGVVDALEVITRDPQVTSIFFNIFGGITRCDEVARGGHVARRLREAGATVVTTDAAPGMGADTTAPAEDLPFADASFDVVACRIAAHHFSDVLAAVREMARVSKGRVVICDNVFVSET